MPKIRKALSTSLNRKTAHTKNQDNRPLRVQGATITSWPGTADIDLDALFAQPTPGATIEGAAPSKVEENKSPQRNHLSRKTVSLSDGTRITFVTASLFDPVEPA